MKLKEITFNTPVKVFQVFKNFNIYTKKEKSLDDRKDSLDWQSHMSYAGHVNNGELYLNERILNNPNFKSCNLITIEDKKERNFKNNGQYSFSPLPEINNNYNKCLNLFDSVKIDDLEIKNTRALELYIHPSHDGISPKRGYFKLSDFKQNQPIEVKLNGKYDFAWNREARTFFETRYIIEYLGSFNKCKILQYPFYPIEKNIPTNTKLIDLIKPLW